MQGGHVGMRYRHLSRLVQGVDKIYRKVPNTIRSREQPGSLRSGLYDREPDIRIYLGLYAVVQSTQSPASTTSRDPSPGTSAN